MRLAIIGSRTFNDYTLVCETLNPYKSKLTEIVSGGARGADELGKKYALDNFIPFTVFIPEWGKYGKSAGFKRNHLIIENCDCAVAFWDGASNGTRHSISLCESLKKPYRVVQFK